MPHFTDHNSLLPIGKMDNMKSGFQALSETFGLDLELKSIMIRANEATDALNLLHLRKRATDPLALRDDFTSIQNSLLSMHSTRSLTPRCATQEVCRIGILLYITSILNELPVGASVCDTLIAKLRQALERIGTTRDENMILEFQLLLMFLSNALASTPKTKEWTRKSFGDAMERLDIKHWDDIKTILKTFGWVEAIHGEYFRALYDG